MGVARSRVHPVGERSSTTPTLRPLPLFRIGRASESREMRKPRMQHFLWPLAASYLLYYVDAPTPLFLVALVGSASVLILSIE